MNDDKSQPSLFDEHCETFNHDGRLIRRTRFDGDDYQPQRDDVRLTGQIERVYGVIKCGDWFTLGDISHLTGDPEASISAQLRHLRKKRFGAHTIERRHIGNGLYQYRMVKP